MTELCCEYLSVWCICIVLVCIVPVSNNEFLDIQVPIECRFTLKRVCNMIRTHSLMHHSSTCNTAQSFGQYD